MNLVLVINGVLHLDYTRKGHIMELIEIYNSEKYKEINSKIKTRWLEIEKLMNELRKEFPSERKWIINMKGNTILVTV